MSIVVSLRVNSTLDLQVGDIITGCNNNCWNRRLVLTKPSIGADGYCSFQYEFTDAPVWRRSRRDVSWEVERGINGIQSAKMMPGVVEEDRFPHLCPKCGTKAYVGFMHDIDHKNKNVKCT